MSHTIPPKKTFKRVCPEDGIEFETVQPTCIYCSNACRQRAYNKRRTTLSRERQEEFAFKSWQKAPLPTFWNTKPQPTTDTPSLKTEEEDTFIWPEIPPKNPTK